MSYFDDASLVMIPSGYKDQKVYSVKPIDGSGDLTFTRSNDTATRVGPDGLIEKVRTNLLLQSNSFDTTWLSSGTTETGGQAGYDGTNNAWLLQRADGLARFVYQTTALSSLSTFSVYAKEGNTDWIFLANGSGENRYFNLGSGTLGAVGTALDSKIEAVGGGWYRCSITISSGAEVRIYPAVGDGVVSGLVGANILIQDAMLEVGDIATSYVGPTTTAAVSVGPVANVPRLDYLGSSCPRLLLEPQRTNTLQYSENFDNAYWSKSNATISPNTLDTLDPSGYYGADKLTDNATLAGHVLFRLSTWDTTQRTASVYAKAGTSSKVTIQNASLGTGVFADLSAGTIVVSSGFTGTITEVGNGWYRITATHTAASAQLLAIGLFTGTSTSAYVGTGSYAYIWGAQLEEGSHETSYINTLGAAVTRGRDEASKTGISSLIGSEGTIFVDFDLLQLDSFSGIIDVNTTLTGSATRVLLWETGGTTLSANFGTQAPSINWNSPTIGRHKVAIIYSASICKLFIDGVKIGQSTTTGSFSGLDVVSFVCAGGAVNFQKKNIHQTLLFTSVISEADAIALTA